MTKVELDINQFIEMLVNVTTFSSQKNQTGGVIRFEVVPGRVVALASDDYVIVESVATIGDGISSTDAVFFLSHKTAKELLKDLHDDTETDSVTVGVFDHEIHVSTVHSGNGGVYDTTSNPNPDLWRSVVEVLDGEMMGVASHEPYAIRQERFAKFSRLKAAKEYPLDIRISDSDILGKVVFEWKFGPDTRGVLSPILRSVAEENWGAEGALW